MGLKIVTSPTFCASGEMITFVVSSERGSHLSYTVTYADGLVVSDTNPNILAFQTPIPFAHAFSNPGNYTVVVLAQNTKGSMSASTVVNIQNSLHQLALTAPTTIIFPSGEVQFEVVSHVISYSHLYLQWDFGNTESAQEYVAVLTPTLLHTHTYRYFVTDIGEHNVQVNCSNMVSYSVLTTKLTVTQTIKNVKFVSSSQFVQTGSSVTFTVTIDSGSHLIIIINYGDGTNDTSSLLSVAGGATAYATPHSYTMPGHYTPFVTLSNGINTDIKLQLGSEIIIQNPVANLILKSNSPVSIPPAQIQLDVEYPRRDGPPTEVACVTIYDGIFIRKTETPILTNEKDLTIDFSATDMDTSGVFGVTVNCSNLLAYQILKQDIVIQKSIETVKFTSNKEDIKINGTVLFEIRIGAGSDLHIYLEFGTGDYTTAIRKQLFTEEFVLQYSYTYPEQGVYTPFLKVSNDLGKVIANVQINVLEPVTGVAFDRYYYISDISQVKSQGEGSMSNIMPKERNIHTMATTNTGNRLWYQWAFGDGERLVSVLPVASHKYSVAGNYTIVLNVSNALYWEIRSTIIDVYSTVHVYSLTNDGPTTSYSTVNFTLHSRPATKACYAWDMGDGSPQHVYGHIGCKSMVHHSGNFTLWTPVQSMVHPHMYTTMETFTVNVRASNLLSKSNISETVVISGINCHQPEVNIVGDGENPDEPIVKLRSNKIFFETNVKLHCPALQHAEYKWTIQQLKPGDTYHTIIPMDFPVDASKLKTDKLSFPARTFPVGNYVIRLHVSMSIEPAIGTSDTVHLHISPSPLFVTIDGGSARSLGYDLNVNIDAESVSFDPDVDKSDKSGLTFTWWCRKKSEKFEFFGDDIIDPIIKMPSREERVNLTDGTGCFGTGVGKLNITAGKFPLNTFLFEYQSTNIIRVQITKGVKKGIAEQNIAIVDGNPPSIRIM